MGMSLYVAHGFLLLPDAVFYNPVAVSVFKIQQESAFVKEFLKKV